MSQIRVLGVLNGRDMGEVKLLQWARSAQQIYAADGAAEPLLRHGLRPVIVGDLDSLDRSQVPEDTRIVQDDDQNTTDCDKLLSLAASDGVKAITLVGIEGDRLDHMLAALSSSVGRKEKIRIALRTGLGYVVPCGDTYPIPATDGQTLSVIPLTLCWGVNLRGVEWELDSAELRPGLHISVSNVARTNPSVSLAGGTCLVIVSVPSEELPAWPA